MMNQEMKETVLQAVDYTNTQAEKYNRRVRICNVIATLLIIVYTSLKEAPIYYENAMVKAATDFMQGMSIAMLLTGLFVSSRYGARVRAFKQRLLKKNYMYENS